MYIAKTFNFKGGVIEMAFCRKTTPSTLSDPCICPKKSKIDEAYLAFFEAKSIFKNFLRPYLALCSGIILCYVVLWIHNLDAICM